MEMTNAERLVRDIKAMGMDRIRAEVRRRQGIIFRAPDRCDDCDGNCSVCGKGRE